MGTEQKVAVITGASQGIGAALVKAYRDQNFRIVAVARSIKPSNDDGVLAVAGDIADPKTAERAISEAVKRFGRVDTLVNNAGIFIAKPFTQYTAEDYANVLGVNVSGFFHITQAAIAEMEKQGSGHVVQITTSLVDHANSNVPSVLALADQGRAERRYQVARHRICQEGHPSERGGAGDHQVADESGRDARRARRAASGRPHG